jgi:gamma-glutamyltranspeptidase / glutathione hydrolase
MAEGEHGIVAAGHPLTAQAGARVLREGGNAVDAALGAMLTSFAAEPLLTGLGAGGYMLVAGGGQEPTLLDFFVQAPSDPRGRDGERAIAELDAVDVSFGDAAQVFYIGPASCGAYGAPAGVCEAARRWGTVPLAELAAPAARRVTGCHSTMSRPTWPRSSATC